MLRRRSIALTVAAAVLLLPPTLAAAMMGGSMYGGSGGMMGGRGGGPGGMGGGRGGGFKGGGFRGKQQSETHAFRHGCHAVCSGFGSRTRCDGSQRSPRYPVHQGVDVAVPVGTPVLAVADGVVVRKGKGPSIGGIGIIVRHSPETIGSSTYTYSFYKHLDRIPDLPIGAKVHKGQRIGASGKSGTEGSRHFGDEGFAELHVEIWTDAGELFPSGHLADPVAFLRRTSGRTGWFCR
jgi:murein DD-endopeptidase MepM/ murein hydrolase activator NlpD